MMATNGVEAGSSREISSATDQQESKSFQRSQLLPSIPRSEIFVLIYIQITIHREVNENFCQVIHTFIPFLDIHPNSGIMTKFRLLL